MPSHLWLDNRHRSHEAAWALQIALPTTFYNTADPVSESVNEVLAFLLDALHGEICAYCLASQELASLANLNHRRQQQFSDYVDVKKRWLSWTL